MKRISNRKFRLGFTCKVFDKYYKEVQCIRCQIKTRLLDFLNTLPATESTIYIKVDYGSNIGMNESTHAAVTSAIDALNKYTEKSMLDFVSGAE